jgi:hypothetical protein
VIRESGFAFARNQLLYNIATRLPVAEGKAAIARAGWRRLLDACRLHSPAAYSGRNFSHQPSPLPVPLLGHSMALRVLCAMKFTALSVARLNPLLAGQVDYFAAAFPR